MKAAVYYGPRDIRIEELPIPEAGPRDVVVKVVSSGICGSDIHAYVEDGPSYGVMPGREFGHEFSAVVCQVGKEVEGIHEGMRVAINPLCVHPDGILVSAMAGGFSEYVRIHNAKIGHNLYNLPEAVSFDEGAIVEPLSVGMHSVNSGQAKPDDRVVIYGAGPIGLSALAGLKALGVKDVIVSDIVDFRLDKAKEMGASQVFNPQKDGNLAEFLKNYHGEVRTDMFACPGTDLYIDAAAVGQILIDTMNFIAKPMSRICIVAIYRIPVTIDPLIIMAKELLIRGSCAYDNEYDQVIGFMKDDKANPKTIITHIFPLSEISEAFETATRADEAIKVLVHMD